MQQTSVQNNNTIRFGSGLVEVGDDVGSLVNLGAMNGVSFEETWDEVEVESDNAGIIKLGIQNQRASISGELFEIDLSNLNEIRGGLDEFEEVTGASLTGETMEVVAEDWEDMQFIPLENQLNASITDVEGNTTSYVEDDDYYVGTDSYGRLGIWVDVGGTNADAAHDLTITYDYDTVDSQVLGSGGKTEINPKVVRITNEDEDGNKFQITIFKAYTNEGISIELQGDDEGEPTTTPLSLEGRLDDERTSGEQLFEIVDEQGVA